MSTHDAPTYWAWFAGPEQVSAAMPDERTAQEFWVAGAELRPVDRPSPDTDPCGPSTFRRE